MHIHVQIAAARTQTKASLSIFNKLAL